MKRVYILSFDEVMLNQLKDLGKDVNIRSFISKMLDKIEEHGPRAGKLLDSQLHLYELKIKHPPIRIYFKPVKDSNEIYVFEYQMKTSEEKQQNIIRKIRFKILNLFKKN